MEIKCAYKSLVDPRTLKPHPLNPNEHGQDQVDMFVSILNYQGWRRPITVSNFSGYITKGHGALAAALAAGCREVPIDYQDYADEAQELADIVADNQLARMSQMNTGKLRTIVENLDSVPSFNLELTGFKLDNLQSFISHDRSIPADDLRVETDYQHNLISSSPRSTVVDADKYDDEENDEETATQEPASNPYSRKIKPPIYEPKGLKPSLEEIFDATKTLALIDEINRATTLTNEERMLLRFAAYRHVVFNYENVAEFYAHSRKEVQHLMEKTALVIIDFNKAIENGFVISRMVS